MVSETLMGRHTGNFQFVATLENVCCFQYDNNLKSSSAAWFDAKYVNEELRIVDKAPSKTPKTLRDFKLCVNYLGLIKPRIALGLGNACFLVYWCVVNSILISTGQDVRDT